MADTTLKQIPDDLFERTRCAAERNFRSINQEIIARLSRSFDAEDAKVSAIHAKWVLEALESGSARAFDLKKLDKAFAAGKAKARTRKSGK